MLSRYDATTRGSVIVCQNASHVIDAVASRQRQQRDEDDEAQVEEREPHRQPEPGQHAAAHATTHGISTAILPAAGLVDLIEGAAVGEVRLLRRSASRRTPRRS